MKIMVVGGARNYANWIDRDIEFIEDTVDNIKSADLVLFTGGSDVDPSIYGYSKNNKTQSDLSRDKRETLFYTKATINNIPIVGVCRGAQLITALQPNGILVQHVTGHGRMTPHEITFNDGDVTLATSTHHQMMYISNIRSHELIAWSTIKLSEQYKFDDNTTIDTMPNNKEPEIVYYSKAKALAIQLHPEYMDKTSRVVVKLNELLMEKFNL